MGFLPCLPLQPPMPSTHLNRVVSCSVMFKYVLPPCWKVGWQPLHCGLFGLGLLISLFDSFPSWLQILLCACYRGNLCTYHGNPYSSLSLAICSSVFWSVLPWAISPALGTDLEVEQWCGVGYQGPGGKSIFWKEKIQMVDTCVTWKISQTLAEVEAEGHQKTKVLRKEDTPLKTSWTANTLELVLLDLFCSLKGLSTLGWLHTGLSVNGRVIVYKACVSFTFRPRDYPKAFKKAC